jgi:hypothetical protein
MDFNHLLTQIARRSVFYFRIYGWIERVYINLINFNDRPPILIYQMGKVGSTSVYRSLKNSAVKHPIFHIHWFSKAGLNRATHLNDDINDPIFDMHFRRCRLLRTKYDTNKIKKWKFITLVRDPIDREISNIFQDIEIFHRHLFDNKKQIKLEETLALVKKKIERNILDVDYCLTWFDKEFNKALSFDVYDFPFDKKTGYTIIRYNQSDVLILKLEKLNECFTDALKDFLDTNLYIGLIKANISDRKKYSSDVKFIRKNLKLSPEAFDKIYSKKFVNHFYSKQEINAFKKKWTKIRASD